MRIIVIIASILALGACGDAGPPKDIEAAGDSLNLALILKTEKDYVCETPKIVSTQWFTVCFRVSMRNKVGVWEILPVDGAIKVLAYNGVAARQLESVQGTFAPKDGMTQAIELDIASMPQNVQVSEVFQVFNIK